MNIHHPALIDRSPLVTKNYLTEVADGKEIGHLYELLDRHD
jgi:hypothetical protein